MGRIMWLFVPVIGLAGACVAAQGSSDPGAFESSFLESSSKDARPPQVALATPAEPAAASGLDAGGAANESRNDIEDVGKQAFEQVCSTCHGIELVTGMRNSRRDWQRVVDRMYQFGLTASDDEVARIVDYLAATYPAE